MTIRISQLFTRSLISLSPVLLFSQILPFGLIPSGAINAADESTLVQQLSSSDRAIRYEAARRLAWCRSNPTAAISSLVPLLTDYSPPFPEKDGAYVQYFGPRVATAAQAALVRIGPPAVPALIEALAHKDKDLKRQVLTTLARIGPAARSALPSIKSHLESDAEFKGEAIQAWAKISPAPSESMPVLKQFLDDPDYVDTVIRVLYEADRQGNQSIPILRRYLTHHDSYTVYSALAELAEFGPLAKDTVPQLMSLLDSDELRIDTIFDMGLWKPLRVDVARTLAAIGAPARDALNKLNELSHTDSLNRFHFCATIVRISPASDFGKDAMLRLRAALKEKDKKAAAALALVPPGIAVPALNLALESTLETNGDLKSPDFAVEVLSSLETHSAYASASVQILTSLIQSSGGEGDDLDRDMIRQTSVRILGQLGKQAVRTLPRLKTLQTQTESFWLKHELAKSIWQIETATE